MKNSIFALWALAAMVIPAGAMATDGLMTGDEFLQQNETRKEIYISDFAVAEDDLAECLEGRSASELAHDLTEWLRNHPDDILKPVHESFARMMLDACAK